MDHPIHFVDRLTTWQQARWPQQLSRFPHLFRWKTSWIALKLAKNIQCCWIFNWQSNIFNRNRLFFQYGRPKWGQKFKKGKKSQKNIKIRDMGAVCEANPAYKTFLHKVWSTLFMFQIRIERHWCQNWLLKIKSSAMTLSLITKNVFLLFSERTNLKNSCTYSTPNWKFSIGTAHFSNMAVQNGEIVRQKWDKSLNMARKFK